MVNNKHISVRPLTMEKLELVKEAYYEDNPHMKEVCLSNNFFISRVFDYYIGRGKI